MRQKLLFVFSLFFIAAVNGQKAILTGNIISQHKAVAYATVMLGRSGKTIADSNGSFRLTGVAPGKYRCLVTAAGYKAFDSIIVIRPEEIRLLVSLQPEIATMDDIIVTGTLRAVKRSESPVAVEIYTPQFFKKNPAPSLFESLQNVNGVRPQLNCNVCNTGDIHINGLEGPYTMITIDGMPIVSSLSSVYGLFGIPTQLIDRVEIVKGPASGLYGSEAVGGLINVITKSPEHSPAFTADVMATSWQEYTVDAGVTAQLGKKIISLVGLNYYNYQQPFDHNNDYFTDVTLQHRISVFDKFAFKRSHDRTASLATRYFYEDRWGGDMQWSRPFRGTDSIYGESIYTNRWELIGNYQLPVQEKMFFSFSATSHRQNSYYGNVLYKGDQRILFGQLLWHASWWQRHQTLLGLAARYNYYDDNSIATFNNTAYRNQPDKNFIPGLFVQNEWTINPHHLLLTGIRYDHHPVHGSIFTPRVAYKWTFNKRQVLRLNAGTGFRVVNLFTEEHAALTGAREVEVLGELKPERSNNVNLNYTQQWSGIRQTLMIDVAVWYSYFHNQILPDYLTDPDKIIYKNLAGHSSSKGITLNMEWNFARRLKTIAGITLQDVAKFERDHAGQLRRLPLMLTEKWSSTWSISYTFPQCAITIDYTGNLYGPMRLPLLSPLDPRPAYSPVWSLQNIQVTKRFSGNWELYAGVKNLLNWTPARSASFLIARSNDPFDKHVQYDTNGNAVATPDNPYALTFDPSYVYAPNQGRRVFVGARISLKRVVSF